MQFPNVHFSHSECDKLFLKIIILSSSLKRPNRKKK